MRSRPSVKLKQFHGLDIQVRNDLKFMTRNLACKAEQVGRLILAGGCVFGVGSLCYYGLGMSGEVGAIDKAR